MKTSLVKFLKYFFLLTVMISPFQCGNGKKKKAIILEKVQPITVYYRLKEKPKGGDFYEFIYMYAIPKKELQKNPDYYQVDYDDYGRIKKSITFSNRKPVAMTLYYYRPDHQIKKIEEYRNGKLNSYIDIQYEDNQEVLLINYSPDKKILRKRVSEYDGELLEKRAVLDGEKKILEMKYEYDDDDNLKKINVYKDGLLKSVEHYRKDRLIREEVIPKHRIEYFYYNNGLLAKEKIYRSGEHSQTIEYDYNQQGDRIQIAIYDRNSLPAGKWLYLNDDGRLQKVEIYRSGHLALTKKMVYSKDGYLEREENWRRDELRSYYLYAYNKEKHFLNKWVKYNPKNEAIEREEYSYNNNVLTKRSHYKGDKLASRNTLVDGKWKKEVFIKETDNSSNDTSLPQYPEAGLIPNEEYVSGLDG